ncbi:MAG: hypothetical protein WD847_01495 [Pirellulales bacterium]
MNQSGNHPEQRRKRRAARAVLRGWISALYLLGVAAGTAWWLVGIVGLARLVLTARLAQDFLADSQAARQARQPGTLAGLNLPIGTPVSDIRIRRRLGYWDGKKLIANPPLRPAS